MHRLISRRAMLRGAGAAIALPWLEVMSPAARKPAEPPRRLAFLFMPNGVRPDHWTPSGDGEGFVIPPHLKTLEPHKSEFLLLEQLWHEQTTGRNGHWPKVPAWLSGGYVDRSTGRDINTGGTSVDQVIARAIGADTALPSLELGVDAPRTGIDNIGGGFARIVGSYISWRDPHTPVAKEIVPRLAFDRLFRYGRGPAPVNLSSEACEAMWRGQGEGIDESGHIDDAATAPATPCEIDARLAASIERDEISILDLVIEDAKRLRAKGSASDRRKLDEYLESVRSVEQRIEASLRPKARWINAGKFDLKRPAAGTPESHQEHVRLMLDIMLLAFWTDTTRVATFMFGDAQTGRDFSFLEGVDGGFHGISHHRNVPEKRLKYEKIINWHVDQLAYLLAKLRSLDEGAGTLLDNSMILFGSSLKDGNRHDHHDLPLLLAGRGKGTLRPGRRLRFAEDTPFCNLHLALMRSMGVEVERFGDSTGPLSGLA